MYMKLSIFLSGALTAAFPFLFGSAYNEPSLGALLFLAIHAVTLGAGIVLTLKYIME
jgi:hypothetical protein